MTNRFYVTTPIYYVNDAPHIGHAYTTILADVLAGYHRLFGEEVRFQTGTDEHGTKVQQSAAQRGVTPQQQVDEYSQRFAEMWRRLGIRYDRFLRTTEPGHYKVVQSLLQAIYDQGDIFKDTYKGWYNIRSEMFIADDEVEQEEVEAGRIVEMEETNYFFKLSKYQDWLWKYINDHPDFIVPESRKNEVLGMLRDPLPDLCISRPKQRLAWGVPLPFDPEFVTYVWFDALINYITGIGYGEDNEQFESWWSACTHLIGKDIIKPHGVFWPIMLKAAGIPLPRKILAHGWWTRGGHKESKTSSSALAAQAPVRHISDLVSDYGAEPVRYFLLREMTLGMDQDYDELMLATRINADLANDLGNLASRTIRIVERDLGTVVPQPGEPGDAEQEILRLAQAVSDQVKPLVVALKPNLALDTLMELVRAANRYFNATAPWNLVRDNRLTEAGQVCYVGLEVLRWASVVLAPVMPERMSELRRQIGLPATIGTYDQELVWGKLEPGISVPGGDPLIPKINIKTLEARLKQEVEAQQALSDEKTTEQGLVTVDEFFRTELKVARVVRAERVPKADKLLKLQIEIGDTSRQIVAGIAQFYEPEALIGKRIVVVANLQPAKIRGLESRGMLLAAKTKTGLTLVTTDDPEFASGASVG